MNAFSNSRFLPLWTGFTVVGMLYFMRVILVNCVEIVLQNTYYFLLLPFTTEDWNQTKYCFNLCNSVWLNAMCMYVCMWLIFLGKCTHIWVIV